MQPATEKRVANPYYTYGIIYLSPRFHEWEASQGPRYRAYRQEWAKRASNLDAGEFPLNLNIEVTTRCNLACTFCPQPAFQDKERYDMPWELYSKVIDEGTRYQTPAANLNGLGEPMLRKDLPEMIAYAKQSGMIDVMFHTNGTIMTEHLARALVEANLDRIIFSVDSPDKATYEAMRIRSDYDRVLKNVRLFHQERQSRGRATPMIRTTMVVTDKTVHQVQNFVNLWSPIADQITLQDLTWRTKSLDLGSWANQERSAIPTDMNEIRREAKEKRVSFVCPYLYQSAYAYGNGDVIPCSNPNARKQMVMGRYDHETLRGVWHGKRYQDLRKLHAEGRWDEHPVCRECEIPLIELYKTLKRQEVSDKEASVSPQGQALLPVASEIGPKDASNRDLVLETQEEEFEP